MTSAPTLFHIIIHLFYKDMDLFILDIIQTGILFIRGIIFILFFFLNPNVKSYFLLKKKLSENSLLSDFTLNDKSNNNNDMDFEMNKSCDLRKYSDTSYYTINS